MKKLLISLFSLIICIVGYATNEENTVAMQNSEVLEEAAEDEVYVVVPIPTGVNGGTVVVRNEGTGRSYTLSNGNAWYDTVTYYIPKGTYRVTSVSVGTCSNGTPGVAKHNSRYTTVLEVGVVLDIEYNGSITFTCP